MNKTAAVLTLTLLITLSSAAAGVERGSGPARRVNLVLAGRINPVRATRSQAPPQSAGSPHWQSREEYDAFVEMTKVQNEPYQAIFLAEAFRLKFPTSDYRADSWLVEMRAYYRVGKIDLAVKAANNVLRFDGDSLDALAFLSYISPFTFRSDDPDAVGKLSAMDANASHALTLIRKLSKPDNVTPQEFRLTVAGQSAVCNRVAGFAGLERGDFAGAITALTAAAKDNPYDFYTFKWLGLAYLYSAPANYKRGVWYLARAAAVAQMFYNTSGNATIQDYLRRVYETQPGHKARLEDLIKVALTRMNPPERVTRSGASRESGSGQSASATAASRRQPWSVNPGAQGTSLIDSGQSACMLNPSYANSPYCRQSRNANVANGLQSVTTDWLPLSDYEPDDQTPLPPPPDADDQIATQLNNLAEEIAALRQEQARQVTREVIATKPAPLPPGPLTILIYKDGWQLQVQNYAVLGKTLTVFSDQTSLKIPLSDLDLPATRKLNGDRGVDFVVPEQP